jgi:crotonobetainyl-CoA:carnitine CoA-transferase CaiB-like acyl-CoA transferase
VESIEHPLWGPVRSIANLFHLSETPGRATHRAPLIGEQSTDVLRELGFSDAEITGWLRDGIVRQVRVEDTPSATGDEKPTASTPRGTA